MFTATFNNISVISLWSVLLVEETGVHGENHRPAAGDWQTLSLKVVSYLQNNSSLAKACRILEAPIRFPKAAESVAANIPIRINGLQRFMDCRNK